MAFRIIFKANLGRHHFFAHETLGEQNDFLTIGNSDTAVEDFGGGGAFDFLQQFQVIDVGGIHSQTGANR